jgi:hypothetical protein
MIDVDTLMDRWKEKWPQQTPGSVDREDKNRWVRFHALPESKRYPETDNDLETILDRHNTLLAELTPGDSLLVVTTEWTNTAQVPSQDQSKRAQLDPEAVHWQTVDENTEEDNPELRSYRHVYVSIKPWQPGVVDEILRAVARDDIAGVTLAPQDLEWLYYPYDGGVDIILPTQEDRDSLKSRHEDWLSTEASGL